MTIYYGRIPNVGHYCDCSSCVMHQATCTSLHHFIALSKTTAVRSVEDKTQAWSWTTVARFFCCTLKKVEIVQVLVITWKNAHIVTYTHIREAGSRFFIFDVVSGGAVVITDATTSRTIGPLLSMIWADLRLAMSCRFCREMNYMRLRKTSDPQTCTLVRSGDVRKCKLTFIDSASD